MKIAIAGAHRVGKTTLAEELAASLPTYTLYKEPYYELEESGYEFSDIPDIEDFIQQFHYSVQQIERSEDNTIFDRCPIDILSYIHAIDPGKNIQTLFETAREIITGTDLLVFVPVETPDLIDCPRSDLPRLRSKVNEILSEWIGDFDIATVEVSGSVIHRRDQVLSLL
ncbi:ATP/GTP-binding protein [Chitinophaga arvensicola]|uniref:AAA domain-containing protein n=1 Tax=Chitinophaga arvensicola TaxID=29529 RepID=A0A1I0RHB4_9BACT|nr:ATP-binding protein [Chitinophaga arvensicola]SEW40279.1 AAA domain-containing protein [Chitinophaga arvensicola]